jgi:parvulin-like peptidyl-prolyl isomerase
LKLYGKEEAPWGEEFEKQRGRIETIIRKKKEKERSDEYLQYLRQKASIKINKDLLYEIQLDGETVEREKWAGDSSPLVEIDNITLTVGDFVSIARPIKRRAKEDILQNWVDRKLVDLEALNRHYERQPDLKRMIYRYENKLLKDMFIKRIIVPQIIITEEKAKEYYSMHQELFIRPARYNLQQITVNDIEEAQVILSNLKKGADFSWWAKTKSIDSAASEGGNVGWFVKSALPELVGEIIDNLNPGDISSILEENSHYMIVRLKEKSDEKVKPYEEVKDTVYKAFFNEQLKTIFSEYVSTLKADADIYYNDKEISSLEEEFFK